MPIVPNRSLVEGKIVCIAKSPEIRDFSVMDVLTTKNNPVPGFVNLSKHKTGDTVQIHIADEVQKAHGLKEGSVFSALVRKAPDNLFVIPDSVKRL